MDPIKVFGNLRRFIALYRTNEMPLKPWAQLIKSLNLLNRLLHIIFTKGFLTSVHGFLNRSSREGFANCN